MKSIVLILVGLVVVSGCGGDDEAARRPERTAVVPVTSSPATTIAPVTTIAAPASSAAATTLTPTPGCAPLGGTADVRVDYPNRMSSLVGKAVRTGTHPCMERLVVELQLSDQPSANFPGYWVRYASGPITLSPSGEPVTVRGAAVLLASLGSPMLRTDNTGYTGPRDVFPTNVSAIEEYRLIEDFEGQSTWAIGLGSRRSFRVSVLDGPPRLVIDIAT